MQFMHNNKSSRYAKILFILSISFILYGFYLQFEQLHHSIDPVNGVIPINEDESTVSITTVDGTEVVTDDSNNSSTPVVSNTDESITQQSVHLTEISSINQDLRTEIENQFGVSVFYGSETNGYVISGVSTTPISDENLINSQLIRLRDTLSLYPEGIFLEIKNGGIPLSIYLVNNYSENSVTGITDSSYNYANISIAAIYPFEESFYHESYHYIERYMFKEGVTFNGWNTLNPEGFIYGSVFNNYSYANTFLDSAPFVNNYAQTADTEDRASTFEYMMASSKASCLNNGSPIYRKAKYMADTMDFFIDACSSNNTERWEKWL
jgi:hypothetical protein